MSSSPSPDDRPQSDRHQKRTRSAIVLFAVLLVVVPLFVGEYSTELTKWRVADAIEKRLDAGYDGDLTAALSSLDEAIALAPDSTQFLSLRAKWRYESGDPAGALQDINELFLVLPGEVGLLTERSNIYLALGEYRRAVDDLLVVKEKWAQLSPSGQLTLRNGLAYARALGALELDEALQDAEQAVNAVGDPDRIADCLLVCLLNGDWSQDRQAYRNQARYLLKRFVALADGSKKEIYDSLAGEFPPVAGPGTKLQKLKREFAGWNARVKLLSGRSKPDAQATSTGESNDAEAKEYEHWVRNELPPIQSAVNLATSFAAFSDTRGFIKYQQGRQATLEEVADSAEKLAEARVDLDAAVTAISVVRQYLLKRLEQAMVEKIDSRRDKLRFRQLERNVAVIFYHRSLVLDQLGETQAAEADRKRVRELGFESVPTLF